MKELLPQRFRGVLRIEYPGRRATHDAKIAKSIAHFENVAQELAM